jgi:group I intron endonuclease
VFIYKITNQINGKVYIGKTVKQNLNTRWSQHVWEAKRGAKWILQRAIRKYGVSQFTIEPLCRVSTEAELNEREKEFIKLFDSTNHDKGYNLTPGGDGLSWWVGKKRSPESIAKQVATRRAKGAYLIPNQSPDIAIKRVATRRAKGNYQENVGRKNTLETLERMKAAALKRDLTPYFIPHPNQSKTMAEKYQAKRDRVKSLYASGLSLPAIAAQLSMSMNFVRKHKI